MKKKSKQKKAQEGMITAVSDSITGEVTYGFVPKINTKKKPKQKPLKGWVGFIDGKPELAYDKLYPAYARLYKSKAEASRFYMDVRRVEIREVKRAKKKKK